MKTLKFDVDNFALTTNVLSILQESYKLVQTLSNVVGPRFVISGCAENAGVIAPGIVCIDGEIMQTAGGSLALSCKVDSTTITKNLQDGSYQYTENKLLFTSGGTFNFSEVKRVTNMVGLIAKYSEIDITVFSGTATISGTDYLRVNKAGEIYALQAKLHVDFGTTPEQVVLGIGVGIPGAIIGAQVPVFIDGAPSHMIITGIAPLKMQFAEVYSQTGIDVNINTIILG